MQKKHYTKEFKLQAIDLSYQRGSVGQVARELGIRPDLLSSWRAEYREKKENAFSHADKLRPPKDKKLTELQALRKRVKELEAERDILKKAVGIFSMNDRTNSDL